MLTSYPVSSSPHKQWILEGSAVCQDQVVKGPRNTQWLCWHNVLCFVCCGCNVVYRYSCINVALAWHWEWDYMNRCFCHQCLCRTVISVIMMLMMLYLSIYLPVLTLVNQSSDSGGPIFEKSYDELTKNLWKSDLPKT